MIIIHDDPPLRKLSAAVEARNRVVIQSWWDSLNPKPTVFVWREPLTDWGL